MSEYCATELSDIDEDDAWVSKRVIASPITTAQAIKKLLTFDPEIHKWTNTLDKPKAGDIIIFYSRDESEIGSANFYFKSLYLLYLFKTEDWKYDGHTWRDGGHRERPQSDPKVVNFYYYGRNGKQKNNEFKKNVYFLIGTNLPALIVYSGIKFYISLIKLKYHNVFFLKIGDESTYRAAAHGSSKDPDRVYESTKKSVLNNLKNELRFKNPHVVYKQNSGKARDLKQLQNAKYYVNMNKRIHLDEIAALHLIHTDLKFVQKIETAPDLMVLAYDEELVQEMNAMLHTFNGTVMETYDTTFNVENFFMSVFLIKHHLLKTEPVVPVVYMFHDRQLESTHSYLLSTVKKVYFIYSNLKN